MQVEELSDNDLIQKARELAGLAKIEKAVKAEIKKRIESGDDLSPLGAKMSGAYEKKRMKKPEDIAEMLLPAFSVEDLYGEPTIVSGKLTVV